MISALALLVACLALYRCYQLTCYCESLDARMAEFVTPEIENEVSAEVRRLTQQLQER